MKPDLIPSFTSRPSQLTAWSRVIKSFLPVLLTGLCLNLVGPAGAKGADTPEVVLERVSEDIRYLASEKLEGRGVETAGIHLAAEHILETYKNAGLKPGMPDGTWIQPFDIQLSKTAVQKKTALRFKNANGDTRNIGLGTFQPSQRGVNGSASGELVFVGYGITSSDDQYDDYAGLNVEGKIILMIRREPQQGAADGAFKGKETSVHAHIKTKLDLATKHKAAGVILVNDPFTASTPSKDELSPPSAFGTEPSGIPFVHVKQSIINTLFAANPVQVEVDGETKALKTVQEIATHIDQTLKPVSQPMDAWDAELETYFNSNTVEAHNLIGVLEGEGDLADETIVAGAHYDHLGYGGVGSRAKNRKGEIHFGADDNATGTAAVMEVIRRISTGPRPKRRIVFICFLGEERGLLGSKYYVENPVFPLEKTVAMLNYDMIGTLRNNKVDCNGVGTALEFRPIVEAAQEKSSLDVKIVEHPYAGSDHLPFFQKKIPVMFCFTGVTPRYHTPDDTFETINVPGVVSIIDFTENLLRGIDGLPSAPQFSAVSRANRRVRRAYLGIIPNLGGDPEVRGVPLQSVRQNSPAANAGFKVGDAIIKANDRTTDNYSDLLKFLQEQKGGSEVVFTLIRNEAELQVKAKLGTPR